MTSTIRKMRINNGSLMNALKTVNNKKKFMKAGYLPIPAGSYDNFPAELVTGFYDGGGLIVEGLGNGTYQSDAVEVDSVTALGEGEGTTIGFSGTPFTANEFHGMHLRVMVGDGAGAYYPIKKNGTNYITIGYNASIAAIEAGDDVRVATPPVNITVDHAIGMDFSMIKPSVDGTTFNYRARVQFSGINFIFEDLDTDYEEVFRVMSEGCGVNFTFCTVTLAGETHIVNFPNGSCINNSILSDGLTGIQTTALYDTMAPGLLINPNGIPTATPVNLQLGTDCMASFISTAGAVKSGNDVSVGRSSGCNLRYSQVGGIVRNGGSMETKMCYIEPCAATEYPYDTTLPVSDRLDSVYIASGKDAIRQKGGEISADKVTTTSGVTDYDLNISQQGKFTIDGDSCTFAATTGNVWFTEKASANAVAWPAQGAVITDSLGANVLNGA